jgi:hypothetical protein
MEWCQYRGPGTAFAGVSGGECWCGNVVNNFNIAYVPAWSCPSPYPGTCGGCGSTLCGIQLYRDRRQATWWFVNVVPSPWVLAGPDGWSKFRLI